MGGSSSTISTRQFCSAMKPPFAGIVLCNALLPPTSYLGSPESVYPSRNGASARGTPSHNKTDARKALVEAGEDAAPKTRRCRRRPVARQPPQHRPGAAAPQHRPHPAAPAAAPPTSPSARALPQRYAWPRAARSPPAHAVRQRARPPRACPRPPATQPEYPIPRQKKWMRMSTLASANPPPRLMEPSAVVGGIATPAAVLTLRLANLRPRHALDVEQVSDRLPATCQCRRPPPRSARRRPSPPRKGRSRALSVCASHA